MFKEKEKKEQLNKADYFSDEKLTPIRWKSSKKSDASWPTPSTVDRSKGEVNENDLKLNKLVYFYEEQPREREVRDCRDP